MKMTKKLFAAVLCFVMMAAVIPASALAAEDSTSGARFAQGRDFSDGVAWVVPITPQSHSQSNQPVAIGGHSAWQCIDKTGRVLFKLDNRSPYTDFSHGVALVTSKTWIFSGVDSTLELIDKTGKVISSPEIGGYDEIRSFIPELVPCKA